MYSDVLVKTNAVEGFNKSACTGIVNHVDVVIKIRVRKITIVFSLHLLFY